MGWGNRPIEEFYLYPMPWKTCDYIYDHKAGLYVPVNHPSKKKQPSQPTPKVKSGVKEPRSATCGVKKRSSPRFEARKAKIRKPYERKKNAGLAADDPSVMFKGLPLVVAMRKKEALRKQFPDLSGAALVAKKEELDAAAAGPEKTPTTDEATSTPSTPSTNTASTATTSQSTPIPEPTAATKPKVPARMRKPEVWQGFTPKYLKKARERHKELTVKKPRPPKAVKRD